MALRVRIPVPKDGIDERREQFEATIGQPRGVRIGDGSALAGIRDIDPRPRILGVDATVTEPTDAPETVGRPVPALARQREADPGRRDDATGDRGRHRLHPDPDPAR